MQQSWTQQQKWDNPYFQEVLLRTFLTDLGFVHFLLLWSFLVNYMLQCFTQALAKHKKFSPILPSCRNTTWAGRGGKLIAQMALWDALVLPVVLENPSGTLTTHTVHVLEAKPLQVVGTGKSFIPEDTCATVMLRSAWNVSYRVHLKVTSLF